MLLESERSGDGLIVRLKGAWSIENIAEIEAALAEVPAGSQHVAVDFSGIAALDLSGAWLLHRWLGAFGERVRIEGTRPTCTASVNRPVEGRLLGLLLLLTMVVA